MAEYADSLLARRTVEAGLITEAALAACRAEQAADEAAGKTRRPLSEILVARGHLTDAQLRGLFHLHVSHAPAGATLVDARAGPSTIVAEPEAPPEVSLPAVRAEPAAPPATGMFDRYRIDGEIARGGMGVVYRAFDTQVQRTVALKAMLTGGPLTDEARARFQREALLAARLHHPNIVPVYEVGEFAGKPFFTMELVEGESLQEILHRMHAIPPRAAVKVARDVARALEHAHEQHLIHRDIKPGNLLITRAAREGADGASAADSTLVLSGSAITAFRVVVTDFGLAKDVTSLSLLTREGGVLGTPMYMSPEQAGGDGERVGPASDLYSLGAVLYEMLSGKKPYDEASAVQMLAAVILDDPEPLRRRAPGLHPDLETIVSKAMEKDPERRYASAKAMGDDLDRYLSGEIIQARPAGPAYRFWRFLVRNRNAVIPAALAVLVVGGVLAYPGAKDAYRSWRERSARAEREAGSAARLRAVRSALAGGDAASALREAEGLVREYGAAAEKGEDHPIAEAHAVLAELHGKAGEERQALRERFQAYRAAVRRGSAQPFLLGMARELVEQARFDEARGILLRIGRGASAEAAYWLARIDEAGLDFTPALAGFRAAGRSALPETLRAECAEHEAFCRLLAGETAVPIAARSLVLADLDGDGKKELVACARTGVVTGGFGPGGVWQERAQWSWTGDAAVGPSAVFAADLDGDGRAEILAAGGSDRIEGALVVLRLQGNALVELDRAPLRSQMAPQPLAVGDLNGDGDPEVMLGTGPYERSLRVYTWQRKPGKLKFCGTQSMGGDVARVLVRDVEGDGAPEVLVFAGPWSAYSIRVMQFKNGKLEFAREIKMGWPTTVEELEPGKGPLVVGNLWYRGNLYPLLRLLGEKRFHERFRAPGVYFCHLDREAGKELEPLEVGDWSQGDDGGYGAVLVRGRGRRWIWVTGRMNGFADAPAGETGARPAGSLWLEEGGTWRRLARLADAERSRFLSPGNLFAAGLQTLDLDGDGEDEVVRVQGDKLRVFGLGEEPKAAAVEEAAPAPPAALAGSMQDLDAARDAERVGLWDDALETYARAAAGTAAEALAATAGRLRCLAALGKGEELAREAVAAAQAWPGREQELLEPAIAALCETRAWESAGRLIALSSLAPGLEPGRRRTASARESTLREMASPAQRIPLIGEGAAPADWLVSSPLVAAWDGKELRFTPPCGTSSFCALPVTLGGAGPALAGTLDVPRLDWATSMMLGYTDSLPWGGTGGGPGTALSLGFSASGDTEYPQRTVYMDYRGAGIAVGETLLFRAMGLPERQEWTLQIAPLPHRLVGTLRGPAGSAVERVREAGPPGGAQGFVRLSSWGAQTAGYWGDYRLLALALLSRQAGDGPRPFAPVTALDHLFLANGRRVFGRKDEAAALYDAAVALAEDAWADEEKRAAAGLPSSWPGATDNTFGRWAAVDARLSRGLFRWAQGDRGGGMEDLRRAWALSSARVERTIQLFAFPLGDRPAESEALSELWFEMSGLPTGEALDKLIRDTVPKAGNNEWSLNVLFRAAKRRFERRVTVVKGAASLLAGDWFETYDGQTIRKSFDLNEARITAEERHATAVKLTVLRGGQKVEVEMPPGLPGVEVAETIQVTREK